MADGPRDRDEPNATADAEAQEATPTRNPNVTKQQPADEQSPHSDDFTDDELHNEKSPRSSFSHMGPEPGFSHVDGDIDGSGYNKTTVDVIAVPCVGASPVNSWARDPLAEGYFEPPPPTELSHYTTVKELPGSSVLSPTISRNLPKASHLWVRQGIRKEASQARVMLYRHRELTEGMTLDDAADDLLEQVSKMRAGLTKSRPIFFICHSIGGLVVKLALVKASQQEKLRPLTFDCHGITFFSTPHRGSSYMSMPHLRESIQELLYLQKPLPISITDELRLGYKPLLEMHEQFMDIASEFRVWTFYETVDSQLSGLGSSDLDEVHFSAPLTSIKSGLLRTRTEQALSLEANHAHCASFGPNNIRTMHSYLHDLGKAIRKAEELSQNFVHTPMKLPSKVKLELIGFYEDPDTDTSGDLRLYVSKHYLDEFLGKGPETCLRERLNTVAPKPRGWRRPTSSMSGALGIWGNVQRMFSTALPSGSLQRPKVEAGGIQSPEIIVTSHPSQPHITAAATEPPSATSRRQSRGLAVSSLFTPGLQRPSSRSSDPESNSDNTARISSAPAGADIPRRSTESALHLGPSIARDAMPGIDEGYHARGNNRHGHVSRASALQDPTAGFSRPDPSGRKFMWIHLPYNNPHWVKRIFDKLSETQDHNYSRLLGNEYWVSRHVQGRHANLHASYVKPGCAFVPAEAHSPLPSTPSQNGRSVSPGGSPSHLYLFLPYLHYDTYVNIVRRRNVIKRRLKHGRARPVPKDIAELESLDSRVIWEFIGHDPPHNARRTLDQYGYPSLRDTYARDDDQMLYKLTKERIATPFKRKTDMYHMGEEQVPLSAVSPAGQLVSVADTLMKSNKADHPEETDSDLENDILDGNLLMVDQVWLWAIDNTTLVTFFPKRESHPTEGPLFQQADLRNSVYNELNGDLTGRCDNALDLAAFTALHAVTVLLDRTSHPDLDIFRIFEEAIGILTERMTSSLKRFRMQTYKDKMHDESDPDEPVDNRSQSIKRRHQRELEQAERENRENTSALLELRDMEDELITLRGLFFEQQATIETMKSNYEKPELRDCTAFGRAFLQEALERLEEYKKQTHDMLERVDNTKKDYEKLQEMVQRQAQVDEVRWSRLQTELASSQNTSVMIFTTFTVIFLPLSFFTSLFGMNTAEWGGEDDNFVSLRLIGAISLPASAFLIAASLLAAFSSRLQACFMTCFRFFRSGVAHTKQELSKLKPRSAKKSELKRRQMKETRELRRKRKRERGYDFWENVLADRRHPYEIPEMNRKAATRRRLAGKGTWKKMVRDGY